MNNLGSNHLLAAKNGFAGQPEAGGAGFAIA